MSARWGSYSCEVDGSVSVVDVHEEEDYTRLVPGDETGIHRWVGTKLYLEIALDFLQRVFNQIKSVRRRG